MDSGSEMLDRLLDPLGRCLTPEVAQHLLDVRADPAAQARIEQLADKNSEEGLTQEERAEYEAYLSAGTFIAILQAKARAMLARSSRP